MAIVPDIWTEAEFREWLDEECPGGKEHKGRGNRADCFRCLFALVNDLQEGRYSAWEQAMGEDL